MISAGARRVAGVLGLILTLFLVLAACSGLLLSVLCDDALRERIVTDPEVLEAELGQIERKVQEASAAYGLEWEEIMQTLMPDVLSPLNLRASRRISELLRNGRLEEAPVLDGAVLEEMLQESGVVIDEDVRENAGLLLQETGKAVTETVLGLRDLLLRAGVKTLKGSMNLPAMSAALQRLPVLFGMLCLLLTGLIALTVSRRISVSFRYIGAALAAAGILTVLCGGLVRLANIGGGLAAVSPMLAAEYRLLTGQMWLRTGILAGGMILAGVLAFWAGGITLRRAKRG